MELKVICVADRLESTDRKSTNRIARFKTEENIYFGFMYYPCMCRFVVGNSYIFETKDDYYHAFVDNNVSSMY